MRRTSRSHMAAFPGALPALVMGTLFGSSPATAQAPTPTADPGTSGSLLNPLISVVGWVQAELGEEGAVEEAFTFREAEIGFQAVVDPYLRADYFIAVSPAEGIDLEEGYMTLLGLPRRFGLKAGKFRSNFGRFNRTHPPETPFADRPLASEIFFGEEGLAAVGASGSYLAPNPFDVYVNLDAEVTATPGGHEEEEGGSSGAQVLEPAGPRDLLYLGRLGAFFEMGEATNLSLGGSFASGAAGRPDDGDEASDALRNQLLGFDVALRWKNPRRAIYRSLTWATEGVVLFPDGGGSEEEPPSKRGIFSFVDYQFARRWHAGLRGDWTELPGEDGHRTGGLLFLTFTPSEFSLVSLQGRRVRMARGETDNRLFLKLTTNIGPHGAHPF